MTGWKSFRSKMESNFAKHLNNTAALKNAFLNSLAFPPKKVPFTLTTKKWIGELLWGRKYGKGI